MKYLIKYENYTKSFYELNLIEFFNLFRKFFYQQLKKNDEIFSSKINDFIFPKNYMTQPLSETMENIIQNILVNKEIEFHDLKNEIMFGRVKEVKLYYLNCYEILLYDTKNFIEINSAMPIKIYNKPTDLETYIEFLSSINKYNL
jgi:hypothetical protein